jgi:2-C-methyl-D-erythritol 4-phosphate cytidylyltransferase
MTETTPIGRRRYMGEDSSVAAIVVAGGSGERFGRQGGKQLARVAGLPVLAWTLRALDESEEVGLIILVCPGDRFEEYRAEAVDPARLRVPVALAAAGATRQASVRSGLAALPDDADIVIVHDGARPLVQPETIARIVNALGDDDVVGAVVGHPSYDTLKLVEGRTILETPERSRFWAVQTPQAFQKRVLAEAHRAASEQGFIGTDDASLVERLGGRVVVVEGPRDNIKVTVSEDLSYVEAALRHRGVEVPPCG